MGRANRDVGGYRGRRTVTDILKFIAVALAVIVVLVLAGMFYLQRYVVYTDDGAKLKLPHFLQMFRHEEGDNPTDSALLPDPGSVSVIIDPAGSASEQPAEENKTGFALELPVEDVVNGAASAKLEEAGAEALILEMKPPSGQLAWNTQNPTAQWAEVSGDTEVNQALERWNTHTEIYTIARVCCFRDDSAPYSWNKLALRKGNYNWRDELGLRWLSPAHEDSQAYIASLCGELAALGFDEIVLEQFHFPVGGNTDNITRGDRYDPAAFTAQLESFLKQVQEAVNQNAANTTVVSLWVDGEILGDGRDLSGVTPQLLQQFGGRIWGDEESLSLLPELQNSQEVQVVPQVQEDRTRFQAVIPEA